MNLQIFKVIIYMLVFQLWLFDPQIPRLSLAYCSVENMMKALTTGNQLARELATQCGIPDTATAESLLFATRTSWFTHFFHNTEVSLLYTLVLIWMLLFCNQRRDWLNKYLLLRTEFVKFIAAATDIYSRYIQAEKMTVMMTTKSL